MNFFFNLFIAINFNKSILKGKIIDKEKEKLIKYLSYLLHVDIECNFLRKIKRYRLHKAKN